MNAKTIALVVLFVAAMAAAQTAHYYYVHYKETRNQLGQQQQQLENLRQRVNENAALDKKYVLQTQQAKENIRQLERDVASGQRRLQFAAGCHSSAAPGATGMANAASPGPDDAVKRHYFTLRERINTAQIQIAGLQEYIRQQCLK